MTRFFFDTACGNCAILWLARTAVRGLCAGGCARTVVRRRLCADGCACDFVDGPCSLRLLSLEYVFATLELPGCASCRSHCFVCLLIDDRARLHAGTS